MIKSLIHNFFQKIGFMVLSKIRYDELRKLKNYKPSEEILAEHLRRLFDLHNVECVFDVGAHEGEYAEWLRKEVGFKGHVFSFEPIPLQIRVLEQKSASDPLWTICPYALGRCDETREFHVMESDVFSSFLTPDPSQPDKYTDSNRVHQSIGVRVSTVAAAWKEISARHGLRSMYLKMDTQGFDLEVFAGAQPVLDSIVALQSELAFRKIYRNGPDYREAFEVFSSAKYRLSMLHPISFDELKSMIEADAVFVRDC
jgi:FkbM family methyltransferase